MTIHEEVTHAQLRRSRQYLQPSTCITLSSLSLYDNRIVFFALSPPSILMPDLSPIKGVLYKLLKWITLIPLSFPKRWVVSRGFIIILPGLIFGYIKYQYPDTLDTPWVHTILKQLIESSPWAVPALLLSPFFISVCLDIWEWGADYIKERSSNYFPTIQLLASLSSLNIIVGKKLNRFGNICRKIKNEEIKKDAVFEMLTQPGLQIAEIIIQFHAAMKELTGITDLKVVLVSVEKGRPKNYIEHMPPTERPLDEILDSGKSFFHTVVNRKNFVCIPCIETHLQNAQKRGRGRKKKTAIDFHVDNTSQSIGSIAGKPIFHKHLGEMIYVLTIKSDTPNAITQKFDRNFAELWKVYIDRIILEHSLKNAKEYACAN